MIRMRLAELMAERNIKASRISVDTGVARSTLSGIVNNANKMIQLDTLNTLCNYLHSDPEKFFEYYPVDFSVSCVINSFDLTFNSENEGEHWYLNIGQLDADVYVKLTGTITRTYELQASLAEDEQIQGYETYTEAGPTIASTTLQVVINDPTESAEQEGQFLRFVYDNVPAGFHSGLRSDLASAISAEIGSRISEVSGIEPSPETYQIRFEFSDFYI